MRTTTLEFLGWLSVVWAQILGGREVINLIGAALVLVTAYFGFRYRKATNATERRETRRLTVMTGLIFAFYVYLVGTVFPGSETWVAQLGLTTEGYLARFRDQVMFGGPDPASQSPVDFTINLLKSIGTGVYLAVFGMTSLIGKTPIIIYRKLFGNP